MGGQRLGRVHFTSIEGVFPVKMKGWRPRNLKSNDRW